MPLFYVHPKDSEPTDFRAFDTREEAIAQQQSTRGSGLIITVVATPEERSDWQSRERGRFASGDYLPVPWKDRDCARYTSPMCAHFAHLSIKQPGLIAYTKNDEHGLADRQTAIRPGKYLQDFYREYFNADTIADYIAQCSAEHMSLKIARTADDIERVYRGGPGSCMSHSTSDYQSDQHPTRVYGDSDLGIAYYGDLEHASARAIVWPDQKIFGRRYGNGSVLVKLLEQAGYEDAYSDPERFHGAKIRAIRQDDDECYILPYIDNINHAEVSRCGKWIILGDGDLDCQRTDGLSGDRDNRTGVCSHCDSEYEIENEDDDSGYCVNCDQARFDCHRCGGMYFEDSTEIRGNFYCESCEREIRQTCAVCDETFYHEQFTIAQRTNRTRDRVTDLCADCVNTHRRCDHCDEFTATDDLTCEHCDRPERCATTGDLLSTEETEIEESVEVATDGSPTSATSDVFAPIRNPLEDRPMQGRQTLDEAIQSARFVLASTDSNCLIAHCRVPMWIGSVVLRTIDGYGYCPRCVELFRIQNRPVSAMPDLYRGQSEARALAQTICGLPRIEDESCSPF